MIAPKEQHRFSRNSFWLVGQDGILRRLGKPPRWRVNNPPQVGNLPHKPPKFLFFLTAALLAAAGKPDFSGTWKLDLQKSDFGPLPVPSKYERVIEHTAPTVHVVTHQATGAGDQTIETRFRTDGEFEENHYQTGVARVSGRWNATNLEVETRRELQDKTLTSVEVWSLSPDTKTLTIKSHIDTPKGPLDLTLVLRR
jgi:hypothetical protein